MDSPLLATETGSGLANQTERAKNDVESEKAGLLAQGLSPSGGAARILVWKLSNFRTWEPQALGIPARPEIHSFTPSEKL
jgi:hypothetical protein